METRRWWDGLLVGSLVLAACAPIEAAEKVALRTADGRFLRAVGNGAVRPERFLPGDDELFELLPHDGGTISLKASGGRLLTAEDRDARHLRADSPRAEPGDRETFQITAVEGNRVGLKARGYRELVVFSASGAKGPASPPADKSRPEETVEIFRVGEIPAEICKMLSGTVQGIAAEELVGKPYDKVRSHKVERFWELPAPTLRDPGRTKRQRVLSMIEEYHIKAELEGQPEIEILRMPTLKGYRDSSVSLFMFNVKASLPIKGRLGYKVRGAVSVSTGYSAVVKLTLVGEIRAVKSGDRLSLNSPELRETHVELQRLRVSNDLLDVAHEPIEDLANHELRHNEERIRQQANKSLAKAVKSREFHSPLLRFLSLP
jgi:hypothetical protein